MGAITLEFLTEQLDVAEQLLAGRDTMFEPQDLPGRYGRAVRAVDHLLSLIDCEAVIGGGWAVWRHGYFARVTQDLDIALPADRVDEFLRVAAVAGFEVLPQPEGRWPKVLHKETNVKVDILPEGAQPGSATKPAPTTIPHPREMGASGPKLRYMQFRSLIELKLAAGRARDESDVIELMRANPDRFDELRQHLASVHPLYLVAFDRLAERARTETDK